MSRVVERGIVALMINWNIVLKVSVVENGMFSAIVLKTDLALDSVTL